MVEVVPLRIVLRDKINFPLPRPPLDIRFALNCRRDVVVAFEIYQPLQVVTPGETCRQSFLMFPNPPDQVVRHTDVKRAVRAIGQKVDPPAFFSVRAARGLSVVARMAGTGLAMTARESRPLILSRSSEP